MPVRFTTLFEAFRNGVYLFTFSEMKHRTPEINLVLSVLFECADKSKIEFLESDNWTPSSVFSVPIPIIATGELPLKVCFKFLIVFFEIEIRLAFPLSLIPTNCEAVFDEISKF